MTKKILIIGSSAKEYALARILSKNSDVYVAPGSSTMSEFATVVDIREDSASELLDFALENDIEITIPVSKKSLQTNIVEMFDKNNMQIFASGNNVVEKLYDKAYVKKLLYKLKIPTPKFGIFEKQNMALDYLKNVKTPFILKTNDASSAVVLTSQKSAKIIIDSIFAQRNQKVIIEDYVWGTPFSFYALTDGYKALPLGSSILYKHILEGDGGQLTTGMGACVPNYKLSEENEAYLMENVVYPIIDNFEKAGEPYLGVLSINGVLTEEGFIQILGLDTFFQECDASAILELLDANFDELISSCVVGAFSDEVDYIRQKDFTATSLVVMCKNKINNENVVTGLQDIDDDIIIDMYSSTKINKYLELEAANGPVLVLTALGRTITSSTNKVYNEVENIDFKGIYYRKDVSKPLLVDY